LEVGLSVVGAENCCLALHLVNLLGLPALMGGRVCLDSGLPPW
jgi:hypothetical protein